MDKKMQVLCLVASAIALLMSSVSIINNHFLLPGWIDIVFGILAVTAFTLLAVVIVCMIRCRK